MSYYDEDYLAKKIAEETVKQQIGAYNRHRIRVLRIALIGTTIIFSIFMLLFLAIPFMFMAGLPVYMILLIITILYCKKHPKA